jgi:hypothetical protein
MTDKEKRRAPRSRAELVLELYESEGRLVLTIGRLLDLSSLGFRFEGPLGLLKGQRFRARIRMEKNLMLEVPVQIVWLSPKGTKNAYGMEFMGISKVDLAKMEKWVKERKKPA